MVGWLTDLSKQFIDLLLTKRGAQHEGEDFINLFLLVSLTFSAATPDREASGPAEANRRVCGVGVQGQRQAQGLLQVAEERGTTGTVGGRREIDGKCSWDQFLYISFWTALPESVVWQPLW